MLSVEREFTPAKDRYVGHDEDEVKEMPKESLAEKFMDLQDKFRENQDLIKELKKQIHNL